MIHVWLNTLAIFVTACAVLVVAFDLRALRRLFEKEAIKLVRRNQQAADEAEKRYRGG